MSDLDIFKDYVLCTAKHCSLRSRKPKLYGDIKSRYPKITAAMEKLLYFWVDKSHKRATNSTGIRANWINCLLYILKVVLNLHNFPLLNINCTEPYLGPLYRSYIIVQISNCKIPERVLLNGAICKRFSKVSCRWRWADCYLLQVFNSINSGGEDVILAFIDDEEEVERPATTHYGGSINERSEIDFLTLKNSEEVP